MRIFVFAVLFIFLQQPTQDTSKASKPRQEQAAATQETSSGDKRCTDQSPLIVKSLSSPKSPEEAAQDAKDRGEKSANDRHTVLLTGLLVLIGFFQFLVYAYQAKKLRETVESAGAQSIAMERHIGEAARSATAMETIARTIDDGNQAIMRAYLTVTVGEGLYQERRGQGQSDLKFEARPSLINTGNTPARKIKIRIQADILPNPVPDNFDFPLPGIQDTPRFGVLGAHQSNLLFGTVKDFVADTEIQAIKEGSPKALFVWGLVTYEDMFGKAHSTKFGQMVTWLPNKNLFVYFIPGQNDGD